MKSPAPKTSNAAAQSRSAAFRWNVAHLLLLLTFGATLWAFRLWLALSWGAVSPPGNTGATVGIVTNAYDMFSYLAWVQQAYHGADSFTILYTTEPHETYQIALPMWCVGHAARGLGMDPFMAFNLAGAGAALVAVWCVIRAAKALGFGDHAAFWAGFVMCFGSGMTWLFHLSNRLFGTAPHWGADMEYFDLLPSAAFHVYPYHAIGFMLTAALLWFAAEAEKTRLEGPRQATVRWFVALFGTGTMLAWSRPYEPAAFWCVYTAYAASAWLQRSDATIRSARSRVWLVLSLALAPGIAHAAWISLQPIWNNFSSRSLANVKPRAYWLIGFGPLWILTTAGAWFASRSSGARFGLPAIWAAGLFFLLVVSVSSHTKLASGGFLAIALLTGVALEVSTAWARSHCTKRFALPLAGVGLLACAGVPSLGLELRAFSFSPQWFDREILAAARIIRQESHENFPLVLTDSDTGNILPGLAGFRVFAGHVSLTYRFEEKSRILSAAGLHGESPLETRPLPRRPELLQSLVASQSFEFALVRNNNAPTLDELRALGWTLRFGGERWTVLASPSASPRRPALHASGKEDA